MATQPVPYQEPQDTKEVIQQTATRLFAQSGFDGTSIRDIVEEAGVTKPVLYYYFENKEELFISLIQDAYDFFFNEIKTIIHADTDFTDRLKQLIKLYIECSEEQEDTVRIIYNTAFGTSRNHPKVSIQTLEEEHISLLTHFFREGIRNGVIRKKPVKNIVMHFLGCVTAYTNYKLLKLESIPQQIDRHVFDFLTEGIGVRS